MRTLILLSMLLINLENLVTSSVLNNIRSTRDVKQELSEEEDKKLPPTPPPVQHKLLLDDLDNVNYNPKKPTYKTNLLFCQNHKYYAIERIKITERDFNCNNKNVEIHFEYYDDELKVKKGFLSNDSNTPHCIKEHQEHAIKCQKIKRYDFELFDDYLT